MRDPKTHTRALRAALQVARGKRKTTTAAVTGLVMLGGCADDEGSAPGPLVDTPTADADATAATDAVQALVDTMDAAATQDAGPAQTDVAPAPDVAPPAPDTTPPAPDVDGAPDAQSADDVTADQDAEADCITYCYQPTTTACTTTLDCAKDEVLGTCAGSGDPCSWYDTSLNCPVTVPEVMGLCPDGETECSPTQPCPDGQIGCDGWSPAEYEQCDGYTPPVVVDSDPETGAVNEQPWNVICVDGFCHEGNQVSEAAMACCFPSSEEENLTWCEGHYANWEAGCMAWGPPAPPAFDGLTLTERMQRWLS